MLTGTSKGDTSCAKMTSTNFVSTGGWVEFYFTWTNPDVSLPLLVQEVVIYTGGFGESDATGSFAAIRLYEYGNVAVACGFATFVSGALE